MNVLIIADDLSGAADCAAGFIAHGHSAVVELSVPRTVDPSCSIVAVDADTRRLGPIEAAARTRKVFDDLHVDGVNVYKKIDSTLRGNWPVEVASLVSSAGIAIIAPAHPSAGRTVKKGCVLVHGQPLEKTDIWQLEHHGLSADMAERLREIELTSKLINADAYIGRSSDLAKAIEDFSHDGVKCVIVDAETVEGLRVLARSTLDLAVPSFWVGSGGLAKEIAGLMSGPKDLNEPSDPPKGPTLIVVGSLSESSERQTSKLLTSDEIVDLTINPQLLRVGDRSLAWKTLQAKIEATLSAQKDLLLRIGKDSQFNPAEGASLATKLAELAGPYVIKAGSLIATGGETARALLFEAGIETIRITAELETGVTVGIGSGKTQGFHPLVVTKAGAFGSDNALKDAWQEIKQKQSSEVNC